VHRDGGLWEEKGKLWLHYLGIFFVWLDAQFQGLHFGVKISRFGGVWSELWSVLYQIPFFFWGGDEIPRIAIEDFGRRKVGYHDLVFFLYR
jgi:hypothetical protein